MRLLPPRFNRWRTLPAEDASSGATPACAASWASVEKRRPGPRMPASVPAVSRLTPHSLVRGE